jgi:hypothetical protein
MLHNDVLVFDNVIHCMTFPTKTYRVRMGRWTGPIT